eukprot:scaffold4394_cov64-Phaeocystis_antarctica.AAC.1
MAAAAPASYGTSALSTRAAGCSRRSTRAKPQLPPCATPDSGPAPAPPCTATAPLVSSSSGGGGAVRHSSCARRTADCTPRTHGATPSAASSSSATPKGRAHRPRRHARLACGLHGEPLASRPRRVGCDQLRPAQAVKSNRRAVARGRRRVGPQEGPPAEAERCAAHAYHCGARRAPQHRMRKRAAVPKRRHAAHQPARPALLYRRQASRQRTRRAAAQCLAHPRVELTQLRVRRHQPAREPRGKHQQPRHRRSCLARRLCLAPRLQQRRLQRACLDRVAQCRACAVCLQPRHVRRGHAGLGQCRLQQRALRRAVGRRQARAPPVLPNRAPAQHHCSPCRGLRRQLQHHRAARLAARVAVRAVVKRVAPPSRRRHARNSESEVNMRGEHEVDRLEQPVFALVQLYRSPRSVACRKRCRAGGIIRAAGPLQPQHE